MAAGEEINPEAQKRLNELERKMAKAIEEFGEPDISSIPGVLGGGGPPPPPGKPPSSDPDDPLNPANKEFLPLEQLKEEGLGEMFDVDFDRNGNASRMSQVGDGRRFSGQDDQVRLLNDIKDLLEIVVSVLQGD